jgi:hypothetical protein
VSKLVADVIDFKICGAEMQFVEIELDPGEAAIGMKTAAETMKLSFGSTLRDAQTRFGQAVAFQLDCSCAFNRMPR